MEKIKKLKKIFKREKIDGYIFLKMMNFLVNMFQNIMIGLILFLISLVLMVLL